MGFLLKNLNDGESGRIICNSCGARDDTIKRLSVYDDIFEPAKVKQAYVSMALCRTCRARLRAFLKEEA